MEDDNPFVRKTKLRRSPPPNSSVPTSNNNGSPDQFNPFKPNRRLARSPPRNNDSSLDNSSLGKTEDGTSDVSMDSYNTCDSTVNFSPVSDYSYAHDSFSKDVYQNAYESTGSSADNHEKSTKATLRTKAKSPSIKKVVKKERPKSIATDKVVKNNSLLSPDKIPDSISETENLITHSKTTDDIITRPSHDGCGEDSPVAVENDISVCSQGDSATNNSIDNQVVALDRLTSPLVSKPTYLVQHTDQLNDQLNPAEVNSALADNTPVQKAFSDPASRNKTSKANITSVGQGTDVTQSTESLELSRLEHHNKKQDNGLQNNNLMATQSENSIDRSPSAVQKQPKKCAKHVSSSSQNFESNTNEVSHFDEDDEQVQVELKMEMERRLQEMEIEWKKVVDEKNEENKLLKDQVESLQKSQEIMKTVVAEYERTIQQIIADKEKLQGGSGVSKETLAELVHERDQALEDLRSVETSFSDLHRRYEKMKATIDGFKNNEETLKKCVEDLQSRLKKQEEKYQQLKKHAEEKLDCANDEIDKVRRQNQVEVTRLQAALKRTEIQVQSLEQTVEQKTKEIKELSSICDELMAKLAVTS